jgi:hypothetical protein
MLLRRERSTFRAGVPAGDGMLGVAPHPHCHTVDDIDKDPAGCGADPTERLMFHVCSPIDHDDVAAL